MFNVGNRVRACANDKVGAHYRGLAGTVVVVRNHASRYNYLVKFDNPPERSTGTDYQGGYWSDRTLELEVTSEDIEAAIQSIREGSSHRM